MTEEEHKLLGSAADVAAAFEGQVRIEGLYGPEGSHLYHNFTLRDTAEIDELLELAEGRPGPVLELCCGSGRITLPFLRRGYEVVGLDSSPHMLALLSDRLKEPEDRTHADRLSLVEGDMRAFTLGRRFGLVLLGATAIWNLDQPGRAALFAAVREHLADEGRFLLTVLAFDGFEGATDPLENIAMFTSRDREAPVLCTLIDYLEPSGLRSTNIVCHRIEGREVSDTAIYTAWSYLRTPAALAEEVAAAGLKVVAQHEVAGRHRITRRNTSAGRRRLLFEISR